MKDGTWDRLAARIGEGADAVAEIRVHQAAAWAGGNGCRVEDYLARFPQLSDEDALVLILAEADLRRDLPRAGLVEDFKVRFPALAADVEAQFALLDVLEQTRSVAPDAAMPTATAPGAVPREPGTEPAPAVPGYELAEEIGRGGMGVVYRGRDLALGRDVAVKILAERFSAAGSTSTRFLDEARITGQLQHPGVPPIYQYGLLPGGRPFLAMKLIKGRTLGDMLGDAAGDRRQLVAVFEHICQTVGFAHAHGVIHRDLKPANVMVGKFGEVQVMDWGLAKVLTAQTPPADTAAATAGTEIQSGRNQDSATQAGDLLGTLAFMPPEQAGGEVEKIDARADVFGLGAVLCSILTGSPPYVGRTGESVKLMAIRGELADAYTRLDACGADPELVQLAKRCLSAEPAARPKDGAEVARAVAELRAAADDRARQAELDRVRADADRRTAEVAAASERKRRRVQIVLAGVVGLLIAAGGGFAWWLDRLAGQRKTERALREQEVREGVGPLMALAASLRDQGKYSESVSALDRAAQLLSGVDVPELQNSLDQARVDLAFARELDTISSNAYMARHTNPDRWMVDRTVTPRVYRAAFAARGFDFATADCADSARRITASAIRPHLIESLDFWAAHEPDARMVEQLLATLRVADPGPWQNRFRDPAVRRDTGKILTLLQELGATVPHVPAAILVSLGETPGALPLTPLLAANLRDPANFRLNYDLADAFAARGEFAQAEAYFRAALATRPENPAALHGLGYTLFRSGDRQRAIEVLRKAVASAPNEPHTPNSLAWALWSRGQPGDVEEAVRVLEEATKRMPDSFVLFRHLGWVHCIHRKDFKAGLPFVEKAAGMAPEDAQTRHELGVCLLEAGRPRDAIPHLARAVELVRDWKQARLVLARCMREIGDAAGADEQQRIAAALDPGGPSAFERAKTQFDRGNYDVAISEYKLGLRFEPHNPVALNNLAASYLNRIGGYDFPPRAELATHGDVLTAMTHLRNAIDIAKDMALPHGNLGWCMYLRGDLDQAIVELETAYRLDEKMPWIKKSLDIVRKAKATAALQQKKPK